MSQSKKIFTRMCLNNWGGISHKILEFNEYVNLFSGKSGSGKSTVMDAIQVVLYGSFSPNFLNKAADDAKNKRSVLSYLRGEQKDGSANREGCDFSSVIALEIKDTGNDSFTCVGIAFEVRKNDSELKKFVYFSHSGEMPKDGYISDAGICYTNQQIKTLIYDRGRSDVNRIYASKEAYLGALYNIILGYIDQNRFITMEKSAIALKMSNGTGQFIRDYMFPKSESDTVEMISEQLDAYRQIKEKIEDMRNRISLLSTIKDSGRQLAAVQADIVRVKAILRCIDIEDLKARIEAAEEDKSVIEAKQNTLYKKADELSREYELVQQEYIQVSADIKSSNLGSKQQQLNELEKRSRMLIDNSRQWEKIVNGLSVWEEDELVTDYVSNSVLNMIDQIKSGDFDESECQQLHLKIESAKQLIENELEDYSQQKNEIIKQLREKQRIVDDINNNRKPYSEKLRSARAALQRALSERYGDTIKVHIFADMFEVTDAEWKNAIEARLGRLKLSLITEPEYAHTASALFRQMKQFEEIDLINSSAINNSKLQTSENSLYEAVWSDEDYIDMCLRRYLGNVIKCDSVDELENVRDGITSDCYSYSNYIFRHLKKRDYTTNACIGQKVSKVRLSEYEKEVSQLQKQLDDINIAVSGMKAQREFECLKGEPSYYVTLSGAKKELEFLEAEKTQLKQAIENMRDNAYAELEVKEKLLKQNMAALKKAMEENQKQLNELLRQHEKLSGANEQRCDQLELLMEGYIQNEQISEHVQKLMSENSGASVKNKQRAMLTELEGSDGNGGKQQLYAEKLREARNKYIFEYPSGQFNGSEKSNEAYEELLYKYQSDYEPEYEQEFEKQCDIIYKSLRENVIATIHGDIKAARRHTFEINRLLKETNFSDSTYQIKIEPAKNENGQFFDMLMAEELDSKNIDNGGIEGQISFGEDEFYKKYEQKIKLLTDKFMPIREEDEHLRAKKRREMEQYADYRNYLSFSMYEQVTDESGNVIRENYVDDMAGRDSGGEGQNPKYVALLAGFAMLYMQQSNRDSKIKLVLLDEAFSKMDQERSAVCLKYARKMDLQLIVCVPDERLQSLIRNVDCVYGFRRCKNQISMMHIDKGNYLKLMEGE